MTGFDQICSSKNHLCVRNCRGTGEGCDPVIPGTTPAHRGGTQHTGEAYDTAIPGTTPAHLNQNPDIGIWNFQKFPRRFFCKPNAKARSWMSLDVCLGFRYYEPMSGIFWGTGLSDELKIHCQEFLFVSVLFLRFQVNTCKKSPGSFPPQGFYGYTRRVGTWRRWVFW